MEHYKLAETVVESLKLSDLPFSAIPDDVVWMQVKASSRVNNMVGYAKAQLENHSCIVWSGSGQAVAKTLISVELLKKSVKSLHQETHCCYQRATETWKPKENESLDPLKVHKDVPAVHVVLSKFALNPDSSSYQSPSDCSLPFGRLSSGTTEHTSTQTKKANFVHTAQQFSAGARDADNAFKRKKKQKKQKTNSRGSGQMQKVNDQPKSADNV